MQAPVAAQEADYWIGQGDLEPLQMSITTAAGKPVDLTNALHVDFRGVHQTKRGTRFSGPTVIQPPDLVEDPKAVPYIVEWFPVEGQTDVPGMYNVQCVIFWPGISGGPPIPQTCPNLGYRQLYIQPAAA